MSLVTWLLIAAAVLVVLYAMFIAALLVLGRRGQARALAGFIPDCVILVKRLVSDERVPRHSKLLLIALAGYLASPIDLVPELIPIVGQVDDAIIVALVLRRVLRATGPDVVREHWPGPESSLNVLLRLAGWPTERGARM